METRHIQILSAMLSILVAANLPRETNAAIYAQILNLNFLCSSSESNAYVRDIPWDCASYVICMDGQAIPTACPQGKLYAGGSVNSQCVPAQQVDPQRCHRRMWDYIHNICVSNPGAKLPDAEGCSHFFDCTAVNGGQQLMNYIVECPYPTLFSKQTGGCRDFRLVYCGERKEPKAPCEYLQYMQMYGCVRPNCASCSRKHPSCVGRTNGPQHVPDRNDVMMECRHERTIKIIQTSASSSPSASSPSSSAAASSSLSSLLSSSPISSSSSNAPAITGVASGSPASAPLPSISISSQSNSVASPSIPIPQQQPTAAAPSPSIPATSQTTSLDSNPSIPSPHTSISIASPRTSAAILASELGQDPIPVQTATAMETQTPP